MTDTIDIAALVAPLGDDPTGADLTYDAEFAALERAAAGTPDQIIGDETLPGEPPAWDDVDERARALSARTRDLRIGVALTRAWLALHGFQGVAGGLELVRQLLADHWDGVHPRADEDGDLTLRMNSLAPLADDAEFLKRLRLQPLAVSRRFGRPTLRDHRIIAGTLKIAEGSTETPPDQGQVTAAFDDADLGELQAAAAAAKAAAQSLAALQKVLDERAPGQGPELRPLAVDLRDVGRIYDAVLARRAPAEGDAEGTAEDGGGEGESGGGGRRGGAPGRIATRADVVRALEAVLAYYREYEPSSPVPVLVRRAQKLVDKSFLEILQDMTPSGVSEAQVFVGTEDQQS